MSEDYINYCNSMVDTEKYKDKRKVTKKKVIDTNYFNSITWDKYKSHQPKVTKKYRKVGDRFVNDETYTTVTCRNSDLMLLLKLIEDKFGYGQLDFKHSKALLHIYEAIEEAMK